MRRIASHLIIALIVASALSACKQEKTALTPADKTDEAVAAPVQNPPPPVGSPAIDKAAEILGSYVGAFGDNKITLLVTKAGSGSVSGRSIVGGNDRPFDGTVSLTDGSYFIDASEPGDHKDDGVFKFTITQADLNEVKGTWKANDPKRPEKSYALERKKFEYRPNVGHWPQASERLLTTSDVENFGKEDLGLMRNEIFARHGYCFSRKEMRQQFENESWYVPNTVDIKGLLTDVEKKNIALIKRYEKYSEDYGDEYGR